LMMMGHPQERRDSSHHLVMFVSNFNLQKNVYYCKISTKS
jgi:hypothetical protein